MKTSEFTKKNAKRYVPGWSVRRNPPKVGKEPLSSFELSKRETLDTMDGFEVVKTKKQNAVQVTSVEDLQNSSSTFESLHYSPKESSLNHEDITFGPSSTSGFRSSDFEISNVESYENLKDLPPVSGLYIPIEKYFLPKKRDLKPRKIISNSYIMLKPNGQRKMLKRFRVFNEKDLCFDSEFLSENHVYRERDDDYDTDDDVLESGQRRVMRDIEDVINELFIFKTSYKAFVRNLRKPLRNKY